MAGAFVMRRILTRAGIVRWMQLITDTTTARRDYSSIIS